MSYKSTRLLIEAINLEIDALRKSIMAAEPDKYSPDRRGDVFAPTIALRGLVDELGAKALRTTIDDVAQLPPDEYVAAMKPLVRTYHQQLMLVDRLAPCLCEDLKVDGCVVLLVGSDKTTVRAAHDPSRPETAGAVEAVLAALDSGMRGHQIPSRDERALLEEAEQIGWDTKEGEALRKRAKEVALGNVKAIEVDGDDVDHLDFDLGDLGGEQGDGS